MTEPRGLTEDEIKSACKEPEVATKDYLFQQTMYRIKDPKEMKFSLYFMGYENADDIPVDEKERTTWALSRKATLELTHNWGTESDSNLKYHNGNSDPRGFGHIGIMVPDVEAACERFANLGVEFTKRPSEGKMKGIAFIKDPDGYLIEIFNNNMQI